MCFSVIGYLISSLIPKYNCTPEFIRIWPSDCFIILTCSVFHFLHVVKPLIMLFYVKFSLRSIDKSMQGLRKILKDKTLFREYVEFCKNECCVENTLFCKGCIEFKDIAYKILNKNIIDNNNNKSNNTIIVNDINDEDISTVSFNDSLILNINECNSNNTKNYNNSKSTDSNNSFNNSIYNDFKCSKNDNVLLLKMAQDMIEKFILPNSEYEVNIDNKISKIIINTFNNYEKMYNENNLYIKDINKFRNFDIIYI
eukprot:jgi/Orpsp1_1/1184133/evm.model.c7180000088147.1